MLLGREFGWTVDQIYQLRPSELSAILGELQRQSAIEDINEQRNRWNLLAATMINSASIICSQLAGLAGKRRRAKIIEPDDLLGKDAKELLNRLLSDIEEIQDKWEYHIKEAEAKGLQGPWG